MIRFLLFLFTFTYAAFAEDFSRIYSSGYPQPDHAAFLVGNESHRENSVALIEQAPEGGAYLTVGGLRAYVGYALCEKCKSLVIADRQNGVGFFHRLFPLLVRASEGKTTAEKQRTFKHLFFDANEAEWLAAFERTGVAADYRDLVKRTWGPYGTGFGWWSEVLRKEADRKYWLENISGANPFEDPKIFERIHDVVDRRAVGFSLLDFKEPEQRKKLWESLQREKIPVSVFDASNMHDGINDYPGSKLLLKMFAEMAPVAQEKTLLLTTNMVGGFLGVTHRFAAEHPKLDLEKAMPFGRGNPAARLLNQPARNPLCRYVESET